MSSEGPSPQVGFVGGWVWLFPATYLLHIAEEFWAPPGFFVWAGALAGVEATAGDFLAANGLFFVAMVGAVVLTLRGIWGPWVPVLLATVVAINGGLHLLGTVLTRSYSPGLVSGVLVWLPLGVATLRRGARALDPPAFRRGVVAGVLVHVAVPIVGFTISRLVAG